MVYTGMNKLCLGQTLNLLHSSMRLRDSLCVLPEARFINLPHLPPPSRALTLFLTLRSAPLATSALTTSRWPSLLANMRAGHPSCTSESRKSTHASGGRILMHPAAACPCGHRTDGGCGRGSKWIGQRGTESREIEPITDRVPLLLVRSRSKQRLNPVDIARLAGLNQFPGRGSALYKGIYAAGDNMSS